MVDQAPTVMVVVEAPTLRIIYVNEAGRLAAGAAPDPVGRLASDAFAFINPALIEAAARSGSPQRTPPAPGGPRWDIAYRPLTTDCTGMTTVMVAAVDVPAPPAATPESQEQTQAASDTLDALLAYIPEGITISRGPEVHVTHMSAAGVGLTGRDETELTGLSALRHPDAWQVYTPGSDEPVLPEDRPLARATRTGAVTSNETLIIRRPDGSLLPVLCNSGPIRDASGRITGAIMAWHDIAALQLAQSALRDSEQRMRAVLLQIPAAIFIIDAPDGRVTFKSRLVDEVLAHPNPDLQAARTGLQGWAVHPDGSPYELPEYPSRRALTNGETVRAEPMRYWRGDSQLIDLEVYAGPVHNETGDIVAAVTAVFDVTERKDAAAKLLESEERLRVALEAGGLGTWEIDLVANVTQFGPSLAAMLGLPAQPVVWDRAMSTAFLHPDDRERVSDEFARATAQGDSYFCEFRANRTDGSTRWFVSHGRIIRTPDGDPIRAVGVIRDVTDRRLREDRLREAAEARELLLREADHRIKNSLQMVGSLLGLQRSRLRDPDAVSALDSAIARVMAVSQSHKALHQSVDLRHVALDEMIGDLCAHVGTLNPAVRFTCDCPAALELDTERAIPLGLIVSELFTNAAKHAYPSTTGEVLTTVSASDGLLQVVVSDAGVGMAASAAPRGKLGSTIIRALVAQIGAEMNVASAPGQGTRTVLRFPRRPSPPA
jgi:PAS domain S-box-containing protein